MGKLILWTAVALSLIVGTLQARILVKAEQNVEKILFLDKPEYEWVPLGMGNQEVMCLNTSSFIKHQMYMQGLEHNQRACSQ